MATMSMKRTANSTILILAILACLAAGSPSFALDPCADGGSPFPLAQGLDSERAGGIGGTGHSAGGIGGTGHIADGIGGTGVSADGIGGTGHGAPREGGIGGTAKLSGPQEGGIGGTGISDRVIVGVVTGFASVCVGGTEVHYDDATEISIDGTQAYTSSLAVGQVVEVEARNLDGRIQASRMRFDHTVVGPIEAIVPDEHRFVALGQTILVSDETRAVDGAAISLSDLEVGANVEVSGLRRDDGVVLASRVTPSARASALLRGTVDRVAADKLVVSGVEVAAEDSLAGVAVGQLVSVSGTWRDGTLQAARVRPIALAARPRRLDLETYVSTVSPDDTLRIAGYEIRLSPELRDQLSSMGAEQRVRLDVSVRPDGSCIGEDIMPLRPLPPVRPGAPDVRPDHHGEGDDGGRGDLDRRGPIVGGAPPPADAHGRPAGAADAASHPPRRPGPPGAPRLRPPQFLDGARPHVGGPPPGPRPPRPPRPPR